MGNAHISSAISVKIPANVSNRAFSFLAFSASIFIYLKIHLYIPGFGVPYFFAFAVVLYAVASSGHIRRIYPYLLAYLAYLLVQYLLSSSHMFHPSKFDAQYFIYSLFNVTTVLGLSILFVGADVRGVERWARWLIYALVLISIFEIYLGFKPAFDAFRKLYINSSAYYDAASRDVQQYGGVRPNAFTSEPSSLGNFFGVVWVLYLTLGRQSFVKIAESAFLMAAALFLFRTPTLLAYILAAAILLANRSGPIGRYVSYVAAAIFLVASIFIPYQMYISRYSIPSDIIKYFVSTGSFYIRQITPVNTFFSMLSDRPLLGYGSEFVQSVNSINAGDVYRNIGGYYDYDRVFSMQAATLMTNAFWEFLSVNGIFGSIILIVFYRTFFKAIGVGQFWLLASLSAIVWFSHAGQFLAFTWYPVIIFAFILARKEKMVT